MLLTLLNQFSFNPLYLEAITRSAGENTTYRLISLGLIVLVLVGISLMSKVEKALIGNRLGALSMLAAVILTLYYYGIFSVTLLWVGLLIGGFLGLLLSRKVQMIQMPQMVGLLNGFGGLASMLAGIMTLMGYSLNPSGMAADPGFANITGGLAVVVGGLTWTGSAIAAGKLHRIINQKPKVYPGHQLWTTLSLIIALVSAVLFAFPSFASGSGRTILILLAVIFGNLFGYFLAIRVGGADMPITISLLNSFSGVAGAIAGMAVADILLVAVGGIVGASGLILTQIMCKAMNRKLLDILLGKTSAPAPKGQAAAASTKPTTGQLAKAKTSGQAKPAQASGKAEGLAANQARSEAAKAPDQAKAELSGADLAGAWLNEAQRIIIVPGYGMALAQAQAQIKQLSDQMEAAGKQVDFAIHPVAGRMPGHMNVLLAEVDIPYDKLHEMAEINDQFKDTDLCLVVGANDVINPAANTAEGTPIYGMPVLDVSDAKHVVICNFDLKPGYAGVPNPLYKDAETSSDHVVLLLGDAKQTLKDLHAGYNTALKGGESKQAQGSQDKASGQADLAAAGPDLAGAWLNEAEKIIIVPGYGMALAQAQTQIKQLTDQMEAAGKQVDFAIHPVAGRMPGHMNVLLAEVDIPYDKLHEMAEINDQFKDTDLCLVVGANDVINPAANTAEGTPIYGMPVLDVSDAKHVVICNFDLKPGYAGVPNPLYEEAESGHDHVVLLLGDAKQTLKDLHAGYDAALEAGESKQTGKLGSESDSKAAGEEAKAPADLAAAWIKEAQHAIIVPGYGMAIAQAQSLVKQLADRLESAGKQVDFAIHPVAGRMPGHMNVLLAEVDIPYDKLHEMAEINDQFKDTDVCLVVGANDVINPAANTAEGTPIYGMPVLDVGAARHVIICNFDLKPGYAGVPNPLYEEAAANSEHVVLLLGDAKLTLGELLAKL